MFLHFLQLPFSHSAVLLTEIWMLNISVGFLFCFRGRTYNFSVFEGLQQLPSFAVRQWKWDNQQGVYNKWQLPGIMGIHWVSCTWCLGALWTLEMNTEQCYPIVKQIWDNQQLHHFWIQKAVSGAHCWLLHKAAIREIFLDQHIHISGFQCQEPHLHLASLVQESMCKASWQD